MEKKINKPLSLRLEAATNEEKVKIIINTLDELNEFSGGKVNLLNVFGLSSYQDDKKDCQKITEEYEYLKKIKKNLKIRGIDTVNIQKDYQNTSRLMSYIKKCGCSKVINEKNLENEPISCNIGTEKLPKELIANMSIKLLEKSGEFCSLLNLNSAVMTLNEYNINSDEELIKALEEGKISKSVNKNVDNKVKSVSRIALRLGNNVEKPIEKYERIRNSEIEIINMRGIKYGKRK